jgi:hypothetical protein
LSREERRELGRLADQASDLRLANARALLRHRDPAAYAAAMAEEQGLPSRGRSTSGIADSAVEVLPPAASGYGRLTPRMRQDKGTGRPMAASTVFHDRWAAGRRWRTSARGSSSTAAKRTAC